MAVPFIAVLLLGVFNVINVSVIACFLKIFTVMLYFYGCLTQEFSSIQAY